MTLTRSSYNLKQALLGGNAVDLHIRASLGVSLICLQLTLCSVMLWLLNYMMVRVTLFRVILIVVVFHGMIVVHCMLLCAIYMLCLFPCHCHMTRMLWRMSLHDVTFCCRDVWHNYVAFRVMWLHSKPCVLNAIASKFIEPSTYVSSCILHSDSCFLVSM